MQFFSASFWSNLREVLTTYDWQVRGIGYCLAKFYVVDVQFSEFLRELVVFNGPHETLAGESNLTREK